MLFYNLKFSQNILLSLQMHNNLYYLEPGATCRLAKIDSTPYDTLEDLQTKLSTTSFVGKEQHSLLTDPMLNSTGFPYSNSPAIDAGVDVGVDEDYRGISRESQYDGDLPDIGAYERKKKYPTYTGQSYNEWNASMTTYKDSQSQ